MLSGENSILQKATTAKENTERASVVEQARTDVFGYQAENKGTELKKIQLQSVLEKYFKNVPDLTNMEDSEIFNTKLDTLSEYGNNNIEIKEIFDGNFINIEENNIEIVEGVLGEWETNEEGNTLTKYLGSSKNIVIPNKYNGKNITTIGSGIFANSNIETIKISDGLEEILSGAFARCSNLNGNLVLPKGLKKIGSATFAMNEGLVGDLIIPESVTTIEPGAFASCKGFTKLKIEGNIENLNGNAFNSCEFSDAELNMKNIPNGFFNNNNNSANTLKTLILGHDVETIGDDAFQNMNELETLVLGENIKIIGYESFYGCTKLKGNLSIPGNVTTIGERAFYGCTGFHKIIIPNSVVTIGENAFGGIEKNKIINNSSVEL